MRMKDKIRRSFDQAAPDVLGQVLKDLPAQKPATSGTAVSSIKPHSPLREFAATAAAFLLLLTVVGGSLWLYGNHGTLNPGNTDPSATTAPTEGNRLELTGKIKSQIDDAFGHNVDLEGYQYRYYGVYNDYIVVYQRTMSITSKPFVVGGCIFVDSEWGNLLWAIKDGELIKLHYVYEWGGITDAQLSQIYEIHKSYYEESEYVQLLTDAQAYLDNNILDDLIDVPLTYEIEQEIDESYYAANGKHLTIFGDSIRYYGLHNGFYIVFEAGNASAITDIIIYDYVFTHSMSFQIWAIRDGQVMTLQEAFDTGAIDFINLFEIHRIHNRFNDSKFPIIWTDTAADILGTWKYAYYYYEQPSGETAYIYEETGDIIDAFSIQELHFEADGTGYMMAMSSQINDIRWWIHQENESQIQIEVEADDSLSSLGTISLWLTLEPSSDAYHVLSRQLDGEYYCGMVKAEGIDTSDEPILPQDPTNHLADVLGTWEFEYYVNISDDENRYLDSYDQDIYQIATIVLTQDREGYVLTKDGQRIDITWSYVEDTDKHILVNAGYFTAYYDIDSQSEFYQKLAYIASDGINCILKKAEEPTTEPAWPDTFTDEDVVIDGDNYILGPYTFTPVTLTVDGVSVEGLALKDCQDNIANAVIPSHVLGIPVISIGELIYGTDIAFSYNTTLKTVVLPDTVLNIQSFAFLCCSSLESVSLPDSLLYIGESAFESCRNMTTINLPDSLRSIGPRAFAYCDGLTTVILPSGITEIQYSTFAYCGGLQSVQLSDAVTSIGQSAFAGCTALTQINLPEGLTHIGDSAFADCTALTQINLPQSLISIGKEAFKNCASIQELILPAGLQEVGYAAFYNCPGLKEVRITPILQTDEGFCYATGLESIIIEEGVTTVPSFAYCTGLREVYIPDGVTSLLSFRGCSSLTTVRLPNTITSLGSNDCADYDPIFQETAITHLDIPEGVTYLGIYIFYQTPLETLVIPSTLTQIDELAFAQCTPQAVFFRGSQDQIAATVQDHFKDLGIAAYYYSATEPASGSSYWHYVDGKPVIWNAQPEDGTRQQLIGIWLPDYSYLNGEIAPGHPDDDMYLFKEDGTGYHKKNGRLYTVTWDVYEGNLYSEVTLYCKDYGGIGEKTLIFIKDPQQPTHLQLTYGDVNSADYSVWYHYSDSQALPGAALPDILADKIIGTWDVECYCENGEITPGSASQWTFVIQGDGTGTITKNGAQYTFTWWSVEDKEGIAIIAEYTEAYSVDACTLRYVTDTQSAHYGKLVLYNGALPRDTYYTRWQKTSDSTGLPEMIEPSTPVVPSEPTIPSEPTESCNHLYSIESQIAAQTNYAGEITYVCSLCGEKKHMYCDELGSYDFQHIADSICKYAENLGFTIIDFSDDILTKDCWESEMKSMYYTVAQGSRQNNLISDGKLQVDSYCSQLESTGNDSSGGEPMAPSDCAIWVEVGYDIDAAAGSGYFYVRVYMIYLSNLS